MRQATIVLLAYLWVGGLRAQAIATPELPLSPSAAVAPQIAFAGSHRIAAWIEPDAGRLQAAVDGGATIDIARLALPAGFALAAGTDTFLVVWYDTTAWYEPPHPVLARRIGLDGTLLDEEPIVLATDVAPMTVLPFADVLSTIFDGVTYQVVWNDTEIKTRSVSEDGEVSAEITAWGDPLRRPTYSPRLLRTDNATFLVYAILEISGLGVGDWIVPSSSLIAGVPIRDLSNASFTSPLFEADRVAELDAVLTGDRLTYVWSSDGDMFVAQNTVNGQSLVRPLRVVDNPGLGCMARMLSRPAAAWNGSEIVIAWTEGNGCDATSSTDFTMRAIRLNANLSPIDGGPIVLAEHATADGPSIAAIGDGVTITYSRLDVANVPRAFVRTILRSEPSPPRRRTVRH